MKTQKLFLIFATVVVTLTGCESDKNNPIQQEKPLSFTEMKTKYVDRLLTYEFSKQETAEIQKIARSNKKSTLDLKSMSLDEKCDIITQLNELKISTQKQLNLLNDTLGKIKDKMNKFKSFILFKGLDNDFKEYELKSILQEEVVKTKNRLVNASSLLFLFLTIC